MQHTLSIVWIYGHSSKGMYCFRMILLILTAFLLHIPRWLISTDTAGHIRREGSCRLLALPLADESSENE